MGAVTLVTTTELRGDDRPRLFALKTILKSAAEEHGQQRAVLREKDVQALAGTGCAFCARLDAALHSERGLHLAMEFLQGGDLYSLLEREGVGGALGPRRALFYCGCVTLALRHLHLLRIVYRDLKVGTVVTHRVYRDLKVGLSLPSHAAPWPRASRDLKAKALPRSPARTAGH
jgi:serine/threonine protein kinase